MNKFCECLKSIGRVYDYEFCAIKNSYQTWKGKHNGSSKQETHAHEKRKVETVTKTTHAYLEKGQICLWNFIKR